MNPHGRNVGVAAGALLASSATLVCCVLPAVLVSLGAGAALASLVSTVPQLIWLSDHKGLVFGIAIATLGIAAVALWHGRRLPCPVDESAARQCQRLRRISAWLYGLALVALLVGVTFAFVIPAVLR